MSNRSPRLCALILCIAGVANASSAEVTAPTTSYRSPGDMTVEERTAMMTLVGEYNTCVYKEGLAKVEQFPDIRQAADAAMEACKNTVNKLRATIDGYGFEPGFAEQFVHHTQSRAARTLLPELAIRKSG